MLLAIFAVFGELQTLLDDLLVFAGKIIDPLALPALQFYHVILGHTI
jgi:hypothetical protein